MFLREIRASSARPRRIAGLLGVGVLLAIVLAGASTAGAAASCDVGVVDKTFTGTVSNDWATAGNWSPSGVPGAADDTCIPAGKTATNSGAADVKSIEVAGTVDGGGSLTLEGGGQASQIDAGGAFTLSGSLLLKATLNLSGTLTWTNNGYITTNTAADVEVLSGGLFDMVYNGGYDIHNDGSGNGVLHVLAGGTVRKSVNTGQINDFSLALDNDGTVFSSTGVLAFAAGGSGTSSGAFGQAAQTGTVQLAGGTFAVGAGATAPAGTLSVGNAGVVDWAGTSYNNGTTELLTGGTLNLNTAGSSASLLLSGGTLAGSAGFNDTNGGTVTSGTMAGTGATTVSGGNLQITGSLTLNRRLNLSGTLTWTNNGYITTNTAADVEVLSGGLFDMVYNGGYDIHNDGSGNGVLHVLAGGTVRKSVNTGQINDFSLALDNDGTVFSSTGVLAFAAGGSGTSSGAFGQAAQTGTVQLAGGTFAVGAGATAPAGTLSVGNAGVVDWAGTSYNNGTTELLTGGTLNLNTAGSSASLLLSGGTLAGSAGFNDTNGGTVTSGTMAGTGATTVSGGNLQITGSLTLNRRLNLSGTLTWTNNGYITTNTAADVEVLSGGLFDMVYNGGYDIHNDGSGNGVLHVLAGGTVRKSVNTGQINDFSLALDNDGTVFSSTGVLAFAAGGSGTSSGAFGQAAQTGTVQLAGGTFAVGAGATAPAGTLSVGNAGVVDWAGTSYNNGTTELLTGGTLNLNTAGSSASLLLSGGTLAGSAGFNDTNGGTVTSGTMAGTGATTVSGGNLQITGSLTLNRRLNLSGTLTWTNNGYITTNTAADVEVLSGGLFDMVYNGGYDIHNDGSGNGVLHVLAGGTVRKSVNAGQIIDYSLVVTNSGTVAVSNGTLFLNAGLTNFSGTTLTGGKYVLTGGGKLRVPILDIVTNAATITLDGSGAGFVDQSDQNGLRNFKTNNGTLNIGKSYILSTAGAYTQTKTGVLGVTVGGTTPGTDLSRLQVPGLATYAGTLAITTDPAFTPSENQVFTIATHGSKTGKFKTITGQLIPSTTLGYLVKVSATAVTLTAKQAADVKVTGTAPANVGVNSPYSYVWTVHNNGPATATAVSLTDTLPAGVTFVSASSTQGTCNRSGQKVTCKPGSMANGADVTITINVTAPAAPTTVNNKATVKATTLDINAANNKATLKTIVS